MIKEVDNTNKFPRDRKIMRSFSIGKNDVVEDKPGRDRYVFRRPNGFGMVMEYISAPTVLPTPETKVPEKLTMETGYAAGALLSGNEVVTLEDGTEIVLVENATKGAKELAVEAAYSMEEIVGTGADGKITKADVEKAILS